MLTRHCTAMFFRGSFLVVSLTAGRPFCTAERKNLVLFRPQALKFAVERDEWLRQRKARADERAKRAEKLSAPTKLVGRDWRVVRDSSSTSPVG